MALVVGGLYYSDACIDDWLHDTMVRKLVIVTFKKKGAYFLPSTDLSFLIDCLTKSSQPFYEVVTVTVIPI